MGGRLLDVALGAAGPSASCASGGPREWQCTLSPLGSDKGAPGLLPPFMAGLLFHVAAVPKDMWEEAEEPLCKGLVPGTTGPAEPGCPFKCAGQAERPYPPS